MAVELTGFSELIADLAGMAADLDNGPGVDRALQAGAVPVEQQMLANASSDPKIITGALHGSIHTSKVKARGGGGKQVTIGVHVKEKSAYYSNPVEYGHRAPTTATRWSTATEGRGPLRHTPLCARHSTLGRRMHTARFAVCWKMKYPNDPE